MSSKDIFKQSGSEPSLSLQYLIDITNNFSEEVGRGGFGVVYKGQHNGEMVAVKKLLQGIPSSQKQFENEVNFLMELKHPNIVRLVGYCYETRHNRMHHERRSVFVWDTVGLLCLEYLPNGSLKEYISDASSGLNWDTRWKVIEGISYGLQYLHEYSSEPIIHLDLKPANILLDANMLPKISDFGLSRLFDQNKTIHTANATGTYGYMPREAIDRGIITPKSDIFSLGVIIMEVITGHRDYPDIRKSSKGFLEHELIKWRHRLQDEPGYTSLETDCQQIERCLLIGLICVNEDRTKRPTMKKIIDMLQGLEIMDSYIGNERLYQQMQWKIRSLNDSLGDTAQPGDSYNPNHQQATPSRNEPSSSYNMVPNRNTFVQYSQDPNDRHAGSSFNQDIISDTPSNYFQDNAGPREAILDDESQFYRNDNQEYIADGDPLPGIVGFQIIGVPRPGSTLTACGFPTNGTTLCNFQWVRCLEDGTRQSIEGATMYDYVVTADDVGTLLAVDCIPMDDNGRQGDLVRKFANDDKKISCDPDMQNDINVCISKGRADFDVFVLGHSPDEWEQATLVLRRTGYQINFSHKDEVFIDEKYSTNLQAKIPNGRTTQFVLVSSRGVNIPFNTQGITEPNNEDNDVRLRDLIVLVMRIFQNKALDAKRKSKA